VEPLKSQDPKSIGPWKLIGRLGSGGMGIVYLAEKNIQRVALKVVQNFMDSPEVRARLQREVEVMGKIKSARVAKVIDSDVSSDFAWIATEFIDGPDLKTYIESGGVLNEQDWQGLALGLFQGLEEVHAEGIIHRDIKPSNILISNNGPKLIDFGIAQGSDATSLTSTGLVAGSPAWLAPEQIHGETLTSAADIFSAGSVLKFAATGNSPWGDSTSTTTPVIFNKILTKDPDFTGLTNYQKTFLSKLMDKNAKQRITARQATIEIKNQMKEISQESIIEKKQAQEIRLKELQDIEIQEQKRKIRKQKNEKLLLDSSHKIKKIFVKNYKIISISFALVAGGLLFLNFGINQVSSIYSNLTASEIVSTPTPVPTPAIVEKLELSTSVTVSPTPVATNSPTPEQTTKTVSPTPSPSKTQKATEVSTGTDPSKLVSPYVCRTISNVAGKRVCWSLVYDSVQTGPCLIPGDYKGIENNFVNGVFKYSTPILGGYISQLNTTSEDKCKYQLGGTGYFYWLATLPEKRNAPNIGLIDKIEYIIYLNEVTTISVIDEYF
jgi:serine/threonine protein kinase